MNREYSFPARGCFVRVVHPPAPSPCLHRRSDAKPCDRCYRLGLLWAGLTPGFPGRFLRFVGNRWPAGARSTPAGRRPSLPSSRCRPPQGGHLSASLPACHGLKSTPMELHRPRLDGRRNAGFPLLLTGLLPCLDTYGAISTFRRVRSALWPTDFPVYASIVLFPHPSASMSASGFLLLTRCLPRCSYGLANTTATLGNDCWLSFIISGLSPDQKRLAYLGAQRGARAPLPAGARVDHKVRVVVR